MKVKIRKEDTWTPDWQGNLEQPEDERIRFRHRFLSGSEKKQFIYTKPITWKDSGEDERSTEIQVVQDGEGIARKITLGIDNFEYEDDAGIEHVVKTIADLYRSPFTDLIAQYEAYVINCSAVDSKN